MSGAPIRHPVAAIARRDDEDPVQIRVRDLSVRYGSHVALDGLYLDIPRGGITAVVGPSGCGKTTFLMALNRLTDELPGCRLEGSIRLDGTEILSPELDVAALRRRVGMIMQKPTPFPFSVLRNLTLALEEHRMGDPAQRRERAEEALRQVGLWDEVRGRLHRPASMLSGGQQQRLCIARALALEPEVLLLDEPCSFLDPLATAAVEKTLLGLKGRTTLVLVTHQLAQARRLADFVALFWTRRGRGVLVEAAPAESFFRRPRHPLSKAYLDGDLG